MVEIVSINKEKEKVEVVAKQLALDYFTIYNEYIKAGFSAEQAFDLLLRMLDDAE